MALKADRNILDTELGYYLNETASRGVIVCVSTAGSGTALDASANLATVAAQSSGAKPIGLLLNDVTDNDLTKTPTNWHKDEAQKGDKVAILTKGWVVTDKVTTATAGAKAVLTSSGYVMDATDADVAAANALLNPVIGVFRTSKDENGFARLYVDL